jgi:hypothetical protein
MCGGEGQACCDSGCSSGLDCNDAGTCAPPDTSACDEIGEDCCMGDGGGGGFPFGGSGDFCGNDLDCVDGTCDEPTQGPGPGDGFASGCDEVGESCCEFEMGGNTFEFCGRGLGCIDGMCE